MRSQGFGARCGWLAVITLLAWLLAALPAWSLFGGDGLAAAAISAVVCFLPGCIVFRLVAGDSGNLAQIRAVGIGTGLRVVCALGGAAIMDRAMGLPPKNYLIWLGLFYLLTLGVETWLIMPPTRGAQPS
jgi:hypothetical protein